MEFRKLRPEEIVVKVGKVNRGGAVLLLYKDNDCDRNILDETAGSMNWQRTHSRDNHNCIVSIWDDTKKSWISKEDVGGEKDMTEKAIASDSFKRACFNWGIGKELFSAAQLDLFFPKQNLLRYEYNEEKQEGSCGDNFKVLEIEYDGDMIKSITIETSFYGKTSVVKKFTREDPGKSTGTEDQPALTDTSPLPEAMLMDNEIILIGNCRKKRYGDVKNTAEFKSFLDWVRDSNTTYPDAERQQQYERLKKMVKIA